MDAKQSFFRFWGLLWEDLRFEPQPGWETTHIDYQPETGDGTFVLALLDDGGSELTAVSPLVDFERGCWSIEEPRSTQVTAYLPAHPQAQQMVLRREKQVIYSAQVAAFPPEVFAVRVEVSNDSSAQVFWQAEPAGGRPLWFSVIYYDGQQRGIALASALQNADSLAFDLQELPGGEACRVAVIASDGVRSGSALSEPFQVSEKPPCLWIQRPAPESLLPPDQPVTLVGLAQDLAGDALADKGLLWIVDGKQVASGTRMAGTSGLTPGEHEAVLTYMLDKQQIASASVRFTIAERSEAQLQLLRLISAR
jgi:hypothetical protein